MDLPLARNGTETVDTSGWVCLSPVTCSGAVCDVTNCWFSELLVLLTHFWRVKLWEIQSPSETTGCDSLLFISFIRFPKVLSRLRVNLPEVMSNKKEPEPRGNVSEWFFFSFSNRLL